MHPWLRLVDQIVVPSQYLQRVFASHGYQAQVIHNIVDTSNFRFRLRTPLRPRLLSTRNLESLYDVANTLRAYELFKSRHPEAQLTVAGFGREQETLRKWVRERKLQDVTFIGRVEPEHMPRVYDEADIFLNSSLIDNQPISILEAFAAGLAVVSTPTGDIAAMVKDGSRGFIVPQKDPEAMAQAIEKLLEDQHNSQRMVEAALHEVEKYTWPVVCHDWAALYNREAS